MFKNFKFTTLQSELRHLQIEQIDCPKTRCKCEIT